MRRSVLTGIGQTVRKISLINAGEMGCDLMEITAHAGARPEHARWQGKVVSLSGRRGYLSTGDIGYGTGEGFGGWNCRHDWFPFFEGISEPAYTPQQLEKLDEKNIEYNGKMYSQYEISQIQRRYEREIRAAKREQSAFKVAVEEAEDPELRQAMQDSLNYANDVVKNKQAKMRDFIKQTGQDRDYFREQNYPKENRRNSLTSVIEDDKILDRKSGIYVKTKYYDCEVKYYAITNERINNIKPVKLNTLSEEHNKKLTSACKDLLSYMKDEPLGTEGLIAFDMNMNLLSKYKSPHNRGSVSLSEWEQDCIVIHNHPSGMLFSPKDYEQFSNRDSIRIFGAVGNDGSIYFIEKTDDFSALQYDFDYFQLQHKYGYFDDKGEYHFNSDTDKLLFSEEFIDGGENSGFKAYISTNK